MTFEQLLAATPDLRSTSIQVLKGWGYTDDEAHQEALLFLWKISKSKNQPRNVGAVVRVALKNAEIDKTRLKRAKATHVQIENQHDLFAQETFSLEWFFDLTKSLNHRKRTMLYRAYVLGNKYQALAEHYGIARNTVKTRIHRICNGLVTDFPEGALRRVSMADVSGVGN